MRRRRRRPPPRTHLKLRTSSGRAEKIDAHVTSRTQEEAAAAHSADGKYNKIICAGRNAHTDEGAK